MPVDPPTNGWRTGSDPVQRRLRVVTVVVCLGVFAYLAVGVERPLDVIPTAALALGAVMLLLGYESVVRLPVIGRRKDDDE